MLRGHDWDSRNQQWVYLMLNIIEKSMYKISCWEILFYVWIRSVFLTLSFWTMQTDLSFLYYRIWNFEYLSLFRCSLKVLLSLDLSRRYLVMKINIDFGYFLIISGFKLKFDMKNSQSNQKVPKKFPQC